MSVDMDTGMAGVPGTARRANGGIKQNAGAGDGGQPAGARQNKAANGGNVKKTKPKPYQRDYAETLLAMEARRVAAGVRVEDWIGETGMDRRTFQRIRASGRAFPAQIKAMAHGLRAQTRRKSNAHMFEVFDA